MSIDKDKQKALRSEGFTRSSSDPDKWINKSNGHSVKDLGGSYIINSDRHNRYYGQSNADFKKRL